MLEEEEKKPHVERRSVNRVSSAVWPLNAQRVVATGRAAQRRRDWIIQGRRWTTRTSILSLRVLLMLTTLLVVVSSLLVALLGLRFWFLLPVPLLLFTAVLTLPLFLASTVPPEIPSSFSGLVQEPRTGLPSPHPQDVHSHPGFQQEPKNLLAPHTPATPMPVGQPLVRVLETYDLRQPHARQHCALRFPDQDLWQAAATEPLDEQREVPEDPAGR